MATRRARHNRPCKQDLGNAGKNLPKDAWRQPTVQNIDEDELVRKFGLSNEKEVWSPPEEGIALRSRAGSMFAEGKASFSMDTNDLDVIGFGVVMMFQTTAYLFKCFFLISIGAICIVYICNQGSNVIDNTDIESTDILTRSSLVNLGTNVNDNTIIDARNFDFTQCDKSYDTYDENGTWTGTDILDCKSDDRVPSHEISFFEFESWKAPMWEIGYTIASIDVFCSFLFFLVAVLLPQKLIQIRDVLDAGYLSASDYSVYITGLPEKFKKEDIRKHFSDLYNPTKAQSYSYVCGGFVKRSVLPSNSYTDTHTHTQHTGTSQQDVVYQVENLLMRKRNVNIET